MTLKIMRGDIFTSNASALVNPVNCVGVMGKGLALEFKKRFPDNFFQYKEACEDGCIKPGIPFIWEAAYGFWIVNFPTKDHWRNASRLEWISEGLMNMVTPLQSREIKSVAFPMLGCGLGGLPAKEVEVLIGGFALDVPDIEVELWK